MGGIFRLSGPNNFLSENNVYVRNHASTGSVITTESPLTNVIISDDHIQSNTANSATIHAGDLGNIHISDTQFANNTNEGPTIYITSSVKSFICVKCLFRENIMEVEGVLSISWAEQVFLHYIQMQHNSVTLGSMILLKKSTNTTLLMCHFEDNYCSNMPCAASVQKCDYVRVEHFFLINTMPVAKMITQSESQQGALQIDANSIFMDNVHFTGVPGYVYNVHSALSLFFKNVSYECPKSHIHSTKVTNTNPQLSQNSPNDLENDTTLTLQCMQCAENYYRFGLPSLTFMELGDLYHLKANGECYKCPSGGICDGRSVVAHPNYWGFVYKGRLKFVFCSDGFCCPLGGCTTYNGCNEGREGHLCTSCKPDFQLAIVSNNCLQKDECIEGWFYGIMVISGLVYIGLLVAKVEILNVLQQIYSALIKCYRTCKNHRRQPTLSNGVNNEMNHETLKQSKSERFMLTMSDGECDIIDWQVPFDHVEIFHILVFHLQDSSLFQVRFPGMPSPSVQLEEFKEKLISVVRLNSLTFGSPFSCFPTGWTQLNKVLFETSIIVVMIFVLLCYIIIIRVARLRPKLQNRLMTSAYTVFLLTFLFSSQRLSSYALNFISCEDLGSSRYLFIDTTVECYQPWQLLAYCYIGLFILPFWLVLLLGPGLLHYGVITVRSFLLGLMFPGPFVVYWIWLVLKAKKKPLTQSCHRMTTTAVLDEVWSSFTLFPSSNYFCWGGIVELRRLALVFSATLISSNIDRLICMTVVVLSALVIHVRFHPYHDRVANACANLSLCAVIMVGILNFGWATFLYSESSFDIGDASKIGETLITFENILIEIFPLSVVVFCFGYFLYVNLFERKN